MNMPIEISKLKKEVRKINSRLNKIEKIILKLKKSVNEKCERTPGSGRRRRVVSYLHWLENERRNRNLISND